MGNQSYLRINTEEINFLKIQTLFFPSNEKSRVQEKIASGFHKYLNRTKFLDSNPEDTCYYQGTRETLVDTPLINIRESIFRETLVTSTKEAVEVASEDKDTLVSKVAWTCRTVVFSKDSMNKTKPLFV